MFLCLVTFCPKEKKPFFWKSKHPLLSLRVVLFFIFGFWFLFLRCHKELASSFCLLWYKSTYNNWTATRSTAFSALTQRETVRPGSSCCDVLLSCDFLSAHSFPVVRATSSEHCPLPSESINNFYLVPCQLRLCAHMPLADLPRTVPSPPLGSHLVLLWLLGRGRRTL